MTIRTVAAKPAKGASYPHGGWRIKDMRRSIGFFLVVILFLLNSGGVWGDEVVQKPEGATLSTTAVAHVDRNAITIGDAVRYTIEVKADRDMEIQPPDLEGKFEGFTVRDSGASKKGLFGKRTTSFWYLLDTYETGRHTIPGTIIRYRKRATEEWRETTLNDVVIEVKSVLDDQAGNADIKDIRGPVGFPTSLYLYILAGAAASLVIAALIMLVLRTERRAKSVVVPPRPAHEIAYEALMELLKKGYPEKGMIKEYYTSLSDIVRRYLENRFGLRAPEMTTEEFLQSVRHANELNAGQKDLLRDFLSHCDLVKFAGFNPEKHEIDESHEFARKFIDQTKSLVPVGPMVENSKEVVKA